MRILAKFLGGSGTEIALNHIMEGRRVVLARPPKWLSPEALIGLGAKGVLALDTDYEGGVERTGPLVRRRFSRIKDVYTNNCQVAVLYGISSMVLRKRYKFQGFDTVLIPVGLSLVGAILGLLRYSRRGDISIAGETRFATGGRDARYIVLNIKERIREVRRQYAPAGLTPLQIVRSLSDLDLVLLRGAEDIEAGRHSGDIDILISARHLGTLKERFNSTIGTYSVDVYTDDGSAEHTHNGAPYYAPDLAKRIIGSAVIDGAGVKVPSPEWQFISFCYHVLFHGKLVPGADRRPLTPHSFVNADNFSELQNLAMRAGRETPHSVGSIEQILRAANAIPSLDLIGFYSNNDAFLRQRYWGALSAPPGLATFFLRDFGRGLDEIDVVRSELKSAFEILAEGAVSESIRVAVGRGVRGGNWTDTEAEGGKAEAIYWFVCWDPSPKSPTFRTRRKYPRLDNEHVRIKDRIRKSLGNGERKTRGLLHSSDNTREALDHLDTLGLLGDAKLVSFLKSKNIDVQSLHPVSSLVFQNE